MFVRVGVVRNELRFLHDPVRDVVFHVSGPGVDVRWRTLIDLSELFLRHIAV